MGDEGKERGRGRGSIKEVDVRRKEERKGQRMGDEGKERRKR